MPTATELPDRQTLPAELTWDREALFADRAAFEAEFASVEATLPDLAEFQGRLAGSAATLADFLQLAERTRVRAYAIHLWSFMGAAVDATDQESAGLVDRSGQLIARVTAASAFGEPEMIAIGFDTLRRWTREEERLAHYAHAFEILEKTAAHVRSAEVEALLAEAADVFDGAGHVHGLLANADIDFGSAQDSKGVEHPIGQGTINALVVSTDRELRKNAWRRYADAHLALKNGMAACLATGVKRDVLVARARHYRDSLEAALEPNHIPVSVFHALIGEFEANLPTWHRYWRLRKRALGVDQLRAYDTRAQLRPGPPLAWPEAVRMVLDGVSPLGQEYTDALARGLQRERWVDVLPNRGKRMGAWSWGLPGYKPYIFMSFNEDVFSMSTLAHECGHSMHSYFTGKSQPLVYGNYGLFVAETASNMNQALVRARLLAGSPAPELEIAVLEEAMANFYRYFFIMPTLARLELEMHQRVEGGEALTADWLTDRTASLMEEVYGGEVVLDDGDRARTGSTWAQFHSHLYSNFYVYQYATGIAAAARLSKLVLEGGPGAVDRYLDFLRAGSAMYPLDALRHAGVDMTQPEPVKDAFQVMASYVDRLEQLLG